MNKFFKAIIQLYKALPIFGPFSLFGSGTYSKIYSKVYFCKTHKFNLFVRIILFPISLILWYLKATVLIVITYRINSKSVKEKAGISGFNQLVDLCKIAFLKNSPPYYYYYLRLYKNKWKLTEDYIINDHIGPILGYLSRDPSREIIRNKIDFFQTLSPIIPQVAPVHALVSKNEIRNYDKPDSIPHCDFFFKPVTGYGGSDCYLMRYLGNNKFEVENNDVVFDKKNLASFLTSKATDREFMLQPLLQNHLDINNLSNGNLATCRITTYIKADDEIDFLFALFMMPIEDSVTSNTNGIGASVDIPTGKLDSAIGLGNPFQKIVIHPQGKGKIPGTILPFWEEAKSICIQAHKEFPRLPIIGWDIAFTDKGVVLLEGNLVWDVEYWEFSDLNKKGTKLFLMQLFEHLN